MESTLLAKLSRLVHFRGDGWSVDRNGSPSCFWMFFINFEFDFEFLGLSSLSVLSWSFSSLGLSLRPQKPLSLSVRFSN